MEEKVRTCEPWNKKPMPLTRNGGNNKQLATSKFDKKAGKNNLKSFEGKCLQDKYANQTLVMTITGQSKNFMCISRGVEGNIMHPVTCLSDIRAQLSHIIKIILPTDRSRTISN